MILNRQNLSENNWNHFKIVPQGHNNCQLSIVNCQFGEAAKFQFSYPLFSPGKGRGAVCAGPLGDKGRQSVLAFSLFISYNGAI